MSINQSITWKYSPHEIYMLDSTLLYSQLHYPTNYTFQHITTNILTLDVEDWILLADVLDPFHSLHVLQPQNLTNCIFQYITTYRSQA